MVSSLTRNQVRRKPLRVRLPCPPLTKPYLTIDHVGLFLAPWIPDTGLLVLSQLRAADG
jgi:hypothetical protein